MTTIALLTIVGLLTAVYSICEANDIPPGAPIVFGLEAALTFAAGIGGVVFALRAEEHTASVFLLSAFALQVLYVLDAKRRGYRVQGVLVMDYVERSENRNVSNT